MPLFACSRCGCLDNTAHAPEAVYDLAAGDPPLCTVCDGRPWHDEFPRIAWDYATHGLPRDGVLQKRDEPAVPRCRALVRMPEARVGARVFAFGWLMGKYPGTLKLAGKL